MRDYQWMVYIANIEAINLIFGLKEDNGLVVVGTYN